MNGHAILLTVNMHKTTIWLQCKMIQVCLKQYPFTVWRLIDWLYSVLRLVREYFIQSLLPAKGGKKVYYERLWPLSTERSLSCHNFLARGPRLLTTFSKDSHKLVCIYEKEELIMNLSFQILAGCWKIQNQKLISILLCHLFFHSSAN